jgi:hypothetical protein
MKALKLQALALLAAIALALAPPASAAPINTALSVVIDGSGSIDSDDFDLQIDAYSTVLGDTSILPADGSVVINVIQFSTEGLGQVEQTALRINAESDRSDLLSSLTGMTQINGLTDIQEGIALGVSDLDGYLGTLADSDFSDDFSKLVDVSTDGFHNEGSPTPGDETIDAVTNKGYAAVNCLGIGDNADCSWNDGYGTDFEANTFDNLQPVLADKIGQELGTVPTPAPLALLGIGLASLALIRRRVA